MIIRAVLDTNVVVSALLKPQNLLDQVLRLALSGHLTLCSSPVVLDEYAEVLSRPKFKLEPQEISRVMTELKKASTQVQPKLLLTIARHEPDNRLLECAEAALADFLVTGNKRHFPKRWKTTQVDCRRPDRHGAPGTLLGILTA
jgi:putative PIN family toxin of toxin-antitoxin system